MKTILLLLCVLFVVSYAQINDESYNIYRTIIDNEFPPKITKNNLYYLIFFRKTVFDTTESINVCNSIFIDTNKTYLNYHNKQIDNQLIKNYFEIPPNTIKIEPNINSKTKILFVNNYSEISNSKSYGYLRFFQTSFNSDSSQALTGYNFICGRCCGGVHYTVLNKKDNNWVIADDFIVLKY
jgi:hypothetical protein